MRADKHLEVVTGGHAVAGNGYFFEPTVVAGATQADEILTKVEKDEIPTEAGGDFLFNPQWQAIADKYLTVGYIMETFFGMKGATKDPQFGYVRDPFWFQFQELQNQKQQMQMQAQQAQQGGGQPPPGGGGGGGGGGGAPPPGGGGDDSGAEASEQSAGAENQQAAAQAGDDLSKGAEQAQGLLKAEGALPPGKRKILAQHNNLMTRFRKAWEEDSASAMAEVLRAVQADA